MFPAELSCGLVGVALLLSHAARLAWPAGAPLLLACAALAARIPARAALLSADAALLVGPSPKPPLFTAP